MKETTYPTSAPQGESMRPAVPENQTQNRWQSISHRLALPLVFPFLMLSSILLSLMQG